MLYRMDVWFKTGKDIKFLTRYNIEAESYPDAIAETRKEVLANLVIEEERT